MARMPSLSFSDSLAFDALCALIVHGVYKKFEVEPSNLAATVLLLVGVPAAPCYFLAFHIDSVVFSVGLAYGLFYAILISSILLYRLSPFHPLSGYPGPLSLRISKLIGLYRIRKGKNHVYLKSLHDKYGPFVRTGPNELSIAEVEAIPPILGIDGMRKGSSWSATVKPGTSPSLVALRDVRAHHERRKLWNHGFTSAAIKDLQPAVENRVLELVEELGKRASPRSEGPLDLALWLSNFTYDSMGDMVFGGGFRLMSNNDLSGVRAVFEQNMVAITTLGQIPWITGLMHKISAVPKGQQDFMQFTLQCYIKRKNQESTKRDLFHYITNEDGLEKAEVSQSQGVNDVLIAIAGGADTTSTVLAGLFFHLVSNPSVFARLKNEVDSEFPAAEGEPFDAAKLARIPYLNAVINEALRVQPAAPTNLSRCPLEGSRGKTVAGRFIPEDTSIRVPPYVLHRDPRYFSPSPDSFIPERWLDDGSKFTTNTAAFIPFSTGPANCVGKNLAWLEMRMVVATIVQKFDIEFAKGYDPRKWDGDLKDFMVMTVGELPVVLHPRQ